MPGWKQISCSIFLIALVFLQNANGQEVTISGHVRDSTSGETLVNATVYDTLSGHGTVTNPFGFFSLNVPAGKKICLQASYIGYDMKSKTFKPTRNMKQDFSLAPSTRIKEIIVYSRQQGHKRLLMGNEHLTTRDIEALPAIGGETDVLKAYQLMAGVQPGNEGSSDIFVRGGGHDQNLILLDDVPLYYVNHLGGYVSVFNPDIIKSSRLIKGGFPARYGNRLSSVMEVRMDDGNNKAFKGQGTIGMMTSKLAVEGPIIDSTTSFMVSGRRFMWDLLFMYPVSLALTEGTNAFGYNFYDINAKISHEISSKDRLYASFYAGDDNVVNRVFDWESEGNTKISDNLQWGNLVGAFRWNHLHGPKLFSNLTLAYSRYRYSSTIDYLQEDETYKNKINFKLYSGINDLNAKADLEYFHGPRYTLKTGYSIIGHFFVPGKNELYHEEGDKIIQDTIYNDTRDISIENNFYAENIITVSKDLKINAGIRVGNYTIKNGNYLSIEPRFIARYLVHPNVSIKAAFSAMQQNVHLISYPSFSLPNTDLWVPTRKGVKPEKSWQPSIGMAFSSPSGMYEASVEGYYKKMRDLVALAGGISFGEGINWQEHVLNNGTGEAYGIEFMLKKTRGDFSGWANYTFSKSTRHFEGLNFGKPFPFRYDRPNVVNISLLYRFSEHFSISSTWSYSTGRPITLENGNILIPDIPSLGLHGNIVPIYPERNSLRMKDYHRLDLGVQHVKQKKWGKRTWKISVYNVYNRLNPYYYYWDWKKVNGEKMKQLYQKTFFPLILSISYSIDFDVEKK